MAGLLHAGQQLAVGLCSLLHLLHGQLALLGYQLLLGRQLAALSSELCLRALQSCQLLLHIPANPRLLSD